MMKFKCCHDLLLAFFSRLYILTIFLALVSCRCPQDQKFALLNIFSNRSSLLSWRSDAGSSDDCCQWEGITCDHASGHVTGLDLTNRSISATINSSVFTSLNSLRFLNLSYNDFSPSTVPSKLDSLSDLTHLNLSRSGFVGQIPATIGRMTKLVVLDLSCKYGDLKLDEPSAAVLLRNLSRMTKLHLDGVNISSAVPPFLSHFTHLTSLILRWCDLVGEFPASIFEMPNLETLDVSGNTQLNGSFPDFFPRESALRTLKLSATSFSGSLPHSFGNLSRLTELHLSGCIFSGPISSLSGLTELEHLDLSRNLFSGQIPPSLLNLTKLAVLRLYYNNFSTLLDSWKTIGDHQRLRHLEVLDLSHNSLHGTIPFYLFTLPSLKKLHLQNNQLGGELHDFANASSTLESIYLNDNKLKGQIPASILRFGRLQRLRLSSNLFNGSVNFDMFRRIGGLLELDLSHNSLVVNANYVGTSPFPQFEYLGLGSCNLKQFPQFLRRQVKMRWLDLPDNRIAGEIPSWIWTVGGGNLDYLNLSGNSLTSLQRPYNLSSTTLQLLDLHSNQLQGELPLPPNSIRLLDYSENNFTSTISSEFTSTLGIVSFFSISSNKVCGEIPPTICNARYLEVLDLSNNSLRGPIPNCFNNLVELSVLNVKNNQLTGIIPNISSREEYCHLRTLNLNGNQLEGKLPESLSTCRELELLDVGNNRLSGPFPYYQNIFSNLRVLVLRSNEFSGSLSQLCNFSAPLLHIIDASSNNFSGTLPSRCFGGLNALMSGEGDERAGPQQYIFGKYYNGTGYYQDTVMVTTKGLELELVKITTIFKSLDLSNNKLEGEIPKQIGALKLLRVLNMSNNFLKGQIPASIGNARQLESLDLSRNQLSGRIPLEMSSLTFLEVLNLSYNRLVGSIPTGPQFSTFDNDSFIGNPELCGQPLSRQCETSSSNSAPEEQGVEGSGSSPVNWLLISVQVGFTVGLGIVFGPLLLCTKWRMWYFKQVDMMLAYLQERWHYYF